MEIRFAKLEDEEEVLALLDKLGQELNEKSVYSIHNTEAEKIGGPIFREIIARPDTHIFLAIEKDMIVGLATFYLIPNIRHGLHRGHVEDIIVEENMRGRGVGTNLLNAIKEFCKVNHIKTFKLDSNNKLKEAHEFYLKNGGEQTELMFRFDIE